MKVNNASDSFGCKLTRKQPDFDTTQNKGETSWLLGILELLGIVTISVWWYATFFNYQKETALLYNDAVPLTIRVILIAGLLIAFAISVINLFKHRFASAAISFLSIAFFLSRLWF